MMFCTYCGKGFTRKEHLERHIPSHTNVKPHRCSSCQLSFARRDLLQRHHSTYHEVRDPLAPLPAGIPHLHGRTPIACQHCANAKTGCDKRVPCSRCTEKSLPCAARFARRSSKAALRAAQAAASAAYSTIVQEQQEQAQPAQADVPVAFMEIDVTNPEQHQQQQQDAIMAKPAGTPTTPVFPDVARQNAHQNHSRHQQQQQQPVQQQSMQHLQHQQQHPHQHSQPHPQHHPSHPPQQTSPDPSRRQSHEFSSPHSNGVDGLDQFMYLSGGFVAPEAAAAAAAAGYPAELLVWPEYSLELGGMYPGPIPAAAVRPEMSLHMFQHQHHTTTNNQQQHQLPPNHQNHPSHTNNTHHSSAANYSHHTLSSLNTNHGHAGGGGPSPLIHRDHIQAHQHHHSISYSNNSHGPHYGTEVSDASAATSEPMTATSSRVSIHTRATSIVSAEADGPTKPERIDSDGEIAEADDDDADSGGSGGSPGSHIPEMIAAEAAWPLARCNPPIFSGNCPRTAIIHLECLERKSKDEGTWSSLESYLAKVDWDASDLASVVPMSSRTRDRMLAIAQSFLHKALDVHRGGIHHAGHRRHRQRRQQQSAAAARYYCYPASAGGDFNFIVLPPTKILEYFLRSYVRNLANYFTLVVAGCVDPNEMLINNQASTLLLLLMIAQGAAAVPMAEARSLSAGLTETCRISLFDIIEKDVELSADPVALRCALLFMILGAWSGDKWLMDIVMGQRGMYLSMLRHAGMLEPQPSMIPTLDGAIDVELQWRDWLQRDGRNRLVYNWVMVDQELSLFHDTAPMLSITDLQCPLPAPEALWMCSESKQWYATMQRTYGCNTNVSPHLITGGNTLTPSLLDLFQDLLHDRLHRRQSHPTPHQLRLLLHPIQAMLYHLGQTVSCFGSAAASSLMPSASSATPGAVSAAASPLPGPSPPTARDATMRRLDEVHDLLDRWYELARAMHAASPSCMAMRCNLVLYHLIRLNAVTNFLEVERLARREGLLDPSSASYWDLIASRHSRCVYHSDDALMHCGQVMRLLRSIPIDRRPAWWPAAVYRATLIMWVDSLARSRSVRQRHRQQSASATPTASCVAPIPAPLQQPTPPQQRSPRGSPTQMHCRQGSPSTASAAVFAPPPAPPQHPVAIDQIQPGDPGLAQCLSGDGVAHLTRGDGSTFAIDDRPGHVLAYGTMAIDEGAGTRIGDGIKRKLATLGANWGLEMAAYC